MSAIDTASQIKFSERGWKIIEQLGAMMGVVLFEIILNIRFSYFIDRRYYRINK